MTTKYLMTSPITAIPMAALVMFFIVCGTGIFSESCLPEEDDDESTVEYFEWETEGGAYCVSVVGALQCDFSIEHVD